MSFGAKVCAVIVVRWSHGAELLSIKTVGPVRGRVQMSVVTLNTTKTNLKANCKKQLIKNQRDRNGLKSRNELYCSQPPGGLASSVSSGCNVTETNPEDRKMQVLLNPLSVCEQVWNVHVILDSDLIFLKAHLEYFWDHHLRNTAKARRDRPESDSEKLVQ